MLEHSPVNHPGPGHRGGLSGWSPSAWICSKWVAHPGRWSSAGLSGFAGISLPSLLRLRAEAATPGPRRTEPKSVILFWLSGGPEPPRHVGP